MQDVLVKTLMSTNFMDLPQTCNIRSVLDHMTERKHSCVVIVENERPIGIITERDIVRMLQSAKDPAELYLKTAAEIMTSPTITLNKNESLFDAMVVSRANRIRHFPVVDYDEKLRGIITNSDLANAHFHVVEIQSEMIEKSVEIKTQELKKANEELQALSLEDHLLEVGNRRAMEVDLQHTHASALRYQQIYSIVLLDLDFFKRYNDHYGHGAGDEALQATASYIKSNIRKSDRLYRYGGEEMLLLLPATNAKQAKIAANKLAKGLADLAIPHCESPFGVLTISCGVACVAEHGKFEDTWEQTADQADKNLYLAKENGRNRVKAVNRDASPTQDTGG